MIRSVSSPESQAMADTNRPLAPRSTVRSCAGIIILALLLAAVAGCTSTPRPQAGPLATEPAVSRLDNGYQGFEIKERTDIDGETRSDFASAVTFLEQSRYDDAIVLLEQVIRRAPDLTAPKIDIALAYEQKGKLEPAEAHLKAALDLIPGHPVASNVYGLLLRKSGRFAAARTIFEQSLERFPEYLPERKNLGILCEIYLDDPACALQQFEIYSEAAPDDQQVTTWIASLRQRLGSTQ